MELQKFFISQVVPGLEGNLFFNAPPIHSLVHYFEEYSYFGKDFAFLKVFLQLFLEIIPDAHLGGYNVQSRLDFVVVKQRGVAFI